METPETFFALIRNLIAHNDLPTALRHLQTLLDNTPQLDEILLQSARFHDIRKQIRLGMVSHAEANLTQNQIRAGLLELLQEIEHNTAETSSQPDAPALRTELEHAISIVNSKNVVVNSTITAGGDVHIGDKTVNQNADKIYNIDKTAFDMFTSEFILPISASKMYSTVVGLESFDDEMMFSYNMLQIHQSNKYVCAPTLNLLDSSLNAYKSLVMNNLFDEFGTSIFEKKSKP